MKVLSIREKQLPDVRTQQHECDNSTNEYAQ